MIIEAVWAFFLVLSIIAPVVAIILGVLVSEERIKKEPLIAVAVSFPFLVAITVYFGSMPWHIAQ